ncbi:MAG TPA: hypothetical protein ENG35_01980 [Desulfobacteraceae bacterium]|nr:hypothetical protein [Desulfobacteraceae bacterium]
MRDRETANKQYKIEVDDLSKNIVLRIRDTRGVYPILIQDPESGTYRVIKTKAGKLQMIK